MEIINGNIYVGEGTRFKVINTKDIHMFENIYIRVVICLDIYKHKKRIRDIDSFMEKFTPLGEKE